MCWRQPNYCFGLVCFWLLEEKCVLARKQVGRALGADRTGLMKEELRGKSPRTKLRVAQSQHQVRAGGREVGSGHGSRAGGLKRRAKAC